MNRKIIFFNFDDVSHELINIAKALEIEVNVVDIFISKPKEERASKNILCGVNYYDNTKFDSFRDIFSLIDLDNIEKLLEIYNNKDYKALDLFEYNIDINFYTQKFIDKLIGNITINENDFLFFSCWDFNIYWICYIILRLYSLYGEKYIRSKIHIGGISVDTDPSVRAILKILANNIHPNKSFPSILENLFDLKITSRIFQTPTYKNILKIHYSNKLGCNNMCDFCINSIPGLYKNKLYPNLICNNFEEEVLHYNEKYEDLKKIYITNNTLTNIELKQILNILIKTNNKFSWNLFTECCYIDDEMIDLIKESKAFDIKLSGGEPVPGALFLGLDSTLPHVQNLILKKKTKYNNWFELFNKLLDNKIGYDCQVLYGYPYYKYTMNDFYLYKEKFEALNSHKNAVFPILPLVKLYVLPETGIFRWLQSNNKIQYRSIEKFNLKILRKYSTEFTDSNEKLYNSVIVDNTYSTEYSFIVIPPEQKEEFDQNLVNCDVKYWQDCANNCSFCDQRLGTKVNNFGRFIEPSKESLILHTDLLKKFCSQRDSVNISLMGGELFHRVDIKELYEGFEYLAAKIKNISTKSTINVYSDLLFEDLSLLKFFVEKIKNNSNIFIASSYDLYGRFKTNAHIDLYVKNIKELSSLYENIVITSLCTSFTIKNFNFNSYEFLKLNEIKDLPKKWILTKYNYGNADFQQIDNKFQIHNNIWKESEFFSYVNTLLLSSKAEFKTTLNSKKERKSSIIINGKIYE